MSDSDPDKPHCPPSPPRRKNRFNEREFARAVRAARAAGAHRVTCDPATSVYTIFLSDKDAGDSTDTDLLGKL